MGSTLSAPLKLFQLYIYSVLTVSWLNAKGKHRNERSIGTVKSTSIYTLDFIASGIELNLNCNCLAGRALDHEQVGKCS